MSSSFAVTWDYRCPFARIVHDHLVTGLESGAGWDVTFHAFSLDQPHVRPGAPPAWEDPARFAGAAANLAGIVVRDNYPDRFLAVHRALFSARHDLAVDLRDRAVLARVLDEAGVDGQAVLAEVDSGGPSVVLGKEHTAAVDEYQVFGVPTFIVGDRAVFVRLMRGPDGDGSLAQTTIERVLDMVVGWPELNEFKHTSLVR